MIKFPAIEDINAEEFELLVRSWAESASSTLEDAVVTHQLSLPGQDGEYAFDVVATFSAIGGAKFLTLIECKKHKNPIKREIVQILNDKIRSVGAHKGIVVSTAPFQSGAIEYARSNGIGLVQVASGVLKYISASTDRRIGGVFDPSSREFCGIFYAPTDGAIPQPFCAERPYGWSDFIGSET